MLAPILFNPWVSVRKYAVDPLLVNKFYCAEEYIFGVPFQALSTSKGEIGWWWLLLLLLLKFILHHVALYHASNVEAYVTKGDVGNESTSRELRSTPHLMPIDDKSMKKVYSNVP